MLILVTLWIQENLTLGSTYLLKKKNKNQNVRVRFISFARTYISFSGKWGH